MASPSVNFSKAKTVLAVVLLCPCSAGLAPVPAVGEAKRPIFEPGKEYHVTTDNEAIGTKSFNLYVPLDYIEDRTWPVIFLYKGRGEKYNPIICRSAREFTCDRGAIILGMGYLDYDKKK
ncbi:MAG: hypothetical protein ACYTBS_12480, partial [Planctomycetota bacterium]